MFDVFGFLSHSDLSRVTQVCSRWRFLGSDRVLWREIDLSQRAAVVDDKLIADLGSKYSPSIEVLKLCNNTRLTVEGLNTNFSRLSFPSLRELHLCNLTSVTDSSLQSLGKLANRIEHISLLGCTEVTDTGVIALTQFAPKLQDLSLKGLNKITSKSLQGLGPSLMGLNLSGCIGIGADVGVVLSNRSPRLQRLDLHALRISDETVQHLAEGCRMLSTLHLSSSNPFGGTSALGDTSLQALASLPNLKCLNLQGASNVTDSGVAVLVENCKLERLNLGGCYRITDRAVDSLAKHGNKLTHLSLFQCFKLTDVSAEHLSSLPSLQHLDLNSCVSLTPRALDLLAQPPLSKELRSLDVGACRNLKAEHVIAVKAKLPKVKVKFN